MHFKNIWKFFLTEGFWGDSPVSQAPGSHFIMLITQPRSKKNQNSPRTSLMVPGGVVWGKTEYKKSCETVPLRGGWWLGGPGLELTGTRVGATWWSYLPRELVFLCHCCFVRGWLDNILWNYTHDTSDPFFIISVEKLNIDLKIVVTSEDEKFVCKCIYLHCMNTFMEILSFA